MAVSLRELQFRNGTRTWTALALCLGVIVAPTSCVDKLVTSPIAYDTRSISVQTLSLFGQQMKSRLTDKVWRGDWSFRRDRLALVDLELRGSKPDIVVLQEVLSKKGSSSESDRNILLAGALSDYEWREIEVSYFEDTDEVQSLAFAVDVPFQLIDADINREQRFWAMGASGFLAAARVLHEGEPIEVFNIQMPLEVGPKHVWYTFVQDRIIERMQATKTCAERLIIAGYLPSDQDSRRFGDFLRQLGVKDSSTGFCQVASQCMTASPTNDLYLASQGEDAPSLVDRILVSESAIVYSSGRNMDQGVASEPEIKSSYGVARIFPSNRFGWQASIRMPRCNKDLRSGIN